MEKIVIDRYGGTMSNDLRRSNYSCEICQHFDNFSSSSLIPFRSCEDAYNGQTTFQGDKFLMYGGNLYVYGRQSAVDRASILKNTDIDDPSWSTPTNADTAGETRMGNSDLFIEYKGVLYGADADGLWSYDVAGTTWSDSAQDVSMTSVAQGVVHSKTDILCIGYTNATASYIMTKDGSGSFNTTALTLPSNLKIVSLCEYGNYLAIACCSITNDGSSKVFMWDMISPDVNEVFDLGYRRVRVIDMIDDSLMAICDSVSVNSSFPTKIVFLLFEGVGFNTVQSIEASANVLTYKQKYNGRIYFAVDGSSVGGTTDEWTGTWSVGRNIDGKINVAMSYKPDNDTIPQQIKGFILVQEILYVSFIDTGTGDWGMTKTNDQATFSAKSVYITEKYNCGDINSLKHLVGIAVSTKPLLTAGQVVVSYKKDSDSSWTTISTNTTDNSVSREDIKEVTLAKNLPDFHEIQLKFESTGGAIITSHKIVFERKKTLLI